MLRKSISLIITVCILVIVASGIMERAETGSFSLFGHRGVVKQAEPVDSVDDRAVSGLQQKDEANRSTMPVNQSAGNKKELARVNLESDKSTKLSDVDADLESDREREVAPVAVSEALSKTAELDRDSLPEEVVYDRDQRQIVFNDRGSSRVDGVSQRDILAETYSLLDNVSKMLK